MSIYKKTLQDWRGVLAAALISGSFAAAISGPAVAQTINTGKPVLGTPVGLPVRMATISGHVPTLVKQSAALGALSPDQALSFSITLPLRNQAALADLLKGLGDPSDSRYGKYLTPTQFAAQFGPTQAEYNTLIAYLQSKGLTVAQTFPSRTYVSLTGTSAQVNAAFGVAIKQFRAPDGRVFHAPDTEVKVPISVSNYIAAVTGLDNATPPTPLLHLSRPVPALSRSLKMSSPAYSITDSVTPDVQDPGEQGTGPGGGFAPSDLRTAYGLNGTTLQGSGQTIAMVEYGTKFNIKDILKYEAAFGLPRPPITSVLVDGGPTGYSSAATETNLDIDMQIALAPKAAQILVFLQPNTGSATDALNAVYTDGRAKQLSVSYGFGTESATATSPDANEIAINTAYTQLASAGVSVYVSSGDSGSTARSTGTTTSVDISSSAPMVCAVGGTALTVQSPGLNEAYLAESTWNYNGTPSGGADGGGVSKQWPIPSYQTNAATFSSAIAGSNVSTTMRNIPDISCVGSPETGVAIYSSADPTLTPGWYIFGGTSASAPLWAGYTALINQNRALGSQPVLGFPNTSLYALAYTANGLTSNYATLFHDINDGSSNKTITNGTNYAAVTGFDDSTGLGSMQGVNLIAGLSNGTLYASLPSLRSQIARAQARNAAARLALFGLPSQTKIATF